MHALHAPLHASTVCNLRNQLSPLPHGLALQDMVARLMPFWHMQTSTGRPTHRIPNLQLNLLAIDVDHSRAELHANSEVVHGLKALVRELQQQT